MCSAHEQPEGSSPSCSDQQMNDEISSDESSSDESHLTETPTYTAEELGDIFLDFYQFLTTLHYDAAHLKIPPPGGWPSITDELCKDFKSDFVTQVLRCLPYFDNQSKARIHVSCKLVDYSSFSHADFQEIKDQDNYGVEFYSAAANDNIDGAHFICIATGRRDIWLNAREGDITEDIPRANQLSPIEVKDFFEQLKENYRSLRIIPWLGRTTLDAAGVEERDDHISMEQVTGTEKDRMEDLDIQYIRQVYREHGWPDSFRKDEAFKVMEIVYGSDDGFGAWPKSPLWE